MPDSYTNLHEEFQTAIRNGDDRLREHIDRQIEQVQAALTYSESQIRLALEASERLELERVTRVAELAKTERLQLGIRISEGVDRMDAHVKDQVVQIRAALEAMQRETAIALDAARELEVTRVAEIKNVMQTAVKALERRVDDKVEGSAREVKIAFDAAQQAILKSEEAYDKRFAGHNAFREELTERWEKTMPREVAEALISSLDNRLRALELGASHNQGSQQIERRNRDTVEKWHIWAAGGILSFFIAVMIFAANFATGT